MKNYIILLSGLILINCSKSGSDKYEVKADLMEVIPENKAPSAEAVSPPPHVSEKLVSDENKDVYTPKKTDTISKKIIKNGDMKIQVGDSKKAQNQVNEIIKKNNAYIQKEEFQNTDMDDNLILIIRVPHKNFDSLISSFSNGVGTVLSKNISSNDVTEEYTDVAIKLANKRIYLKKYRDMLKSAATTKECWKFRKKYGILKMKLM
ncbi:DUF4349 domain-containing protein [Chryseobacterium sp. CBSDS_008]|uniref:DUF4349 domain-containing protein n=1 Tax=Chryseobacterium sp. CBSDS_008 TaxID=3415265 RepID=UPI003CEAAD75